MDELQDRIRLYLKRISPPIFGNASMRELSDDLDRLSRMILEILRVDQRLIPPFNRLYEIMVEKPAPRTVNLDPETLVDDITVIDAIKDRLPVEGKNLWRKQISLLPPIE
jgi:hypothetical protein